MVIVFTIVLLLGIVIVIVLPHNTYFLLELCGVALQGGFELLAPQTHADNETVGDIAGLV